AHTVPWVFGNVDLYKSRTLAMPVPLSEIVPGNNTLTLSSTSMSYGGLSVANLDLILVGAGGIPGGDPTTASTSPTAVPPPATATAPAPAPPRAAPSPPPPHTVA